MIGTSYDYVGTTGVSDGALAIAVDGRRPVRLHARIRAHTLSVRTALAALSDVLLSDSQWLSGEDFLARILDPVVTVHPDVVSFELFSQDASAWGLVTVPRALLDDDGDVKTGTTNIDFSHQLGRALGQLRSSRDTWLRIGPGGVAVDTEGEGRLEVKVDVPTGWVRGFLEVQAAMAMPGRRIDVRPVDLLAAIRFLAKTKAKVAPRGLRWVLSPDADAQLVLEPWERVVPLRGARTMGEARTIRTWGRRRLQLLDRVLPYAESARVYLKGRAMPQFYEVVLPGDVRFVLGVSGFSAASFAGDTGYGRLAPGALDGADDAALLAVAARAHGLLAARHLADTAAVAEALGVDAPTATRALVRLCRAGRVMYDVAARAWRHRELFGPDVDGDAMIPDDPVIAEARALLPSVRITSAAPRESVKVQQIQVPGGAPVVREVIRRDFVVHAVVGNFVVEAVTGDEGRLLFGRCGCPFFVQHLLARGPCAHLVAAVHAGEAARVEAPASRAAPEGAIVHDDAVRDAGSAGEE